MRESHTVVLLLWQDFTWRRYCTTMRYHGEFLLVRHDLILDFDLFTSHFKGTMR
jgi:hypothetical protein